MIRPILFFVACCNFVLLNGQQLPEKISKEIVEAFFQLDKGIKPAIGLQFRSAEETLQAMQEMAAQRPEYQPIYQAAQQLPIIAQPLIQKTEELRVAITNAGGIWIYEGEFNGKSKEERLTNYKAKGYTNFKTTEEPRLDGKAVNKKDKDITQRILVDEKGVVQLKNLINSTRKKILLKVEEVLLHYEQQNKNAAYFTKAKWEQFQQDLVLEEIDDQNGPWNDLDKSWEEYVFGYMPVAACFPLFRKYQNDAKNAVIQSINFLAEGMGIANSQKETEPDDLKSVLQRLDQQTDQLSKLKAHLKQLEADIQPLLDEITQVNKDLIAVNGVYIYEDSLYGRSVEQRKQEYHQNMGITNFVLTPKQRLENQLVAKNSNSAVQEVMCRGGQGYALWREIEQSREKLLAHIEALRIELAIPIHEIDELKKELALKVYFTDRFWLKNRAVWARLHFSEMELRQVLFYNEILETNAKKAANQVAVLLWNAFEH